MGVGAGLYMYVVVVKVHVRYLISWWVLVFFGMSLFSQQWQLGRALANISRSHYVVISRGGRTLVTRIRVMLPWQRNPCTDCKSAH